MQRELGRFHLVTYQGKDPLRVFDLQQMFDPKLGLVLHQVGPFGRFELESISGQPGIDFDLAERQY